MLVIFNETVVLNIKSVDSLYIHNKSKPERKEVEWLFFTKVIPAVNKYEVKLEYKTPENKGFIFTHETDSHEEAKKVAKEIAAQIMKLDPRFVDEEFEREVLS